MTTVPHVTVLLPCLNEAASLASCIEAAQQGLSDAGLSGEIVVIDNGSTDESAAIALENGARLIDAPIRGYGSALGVGIHEARGEVIVMADADGTYDLRRLGELVAPIKDDEADLVLGSRLKGLNRGTMPLLHRLVGTPLLSFLLRRATPGLDIKDSQSGYRAFRADRMKAIDLKASGMEFASEMLIRASSEDLRIREVPIGYRSRTGDSKLRAVADGWRHLQLISMLAPHLLLFWPGLAVMAIGATLATFSLIQPAGLEIGTLSWQPIFLAPILLVLGATGALAGAVLSYHSTLTAPEQRRRFRFVGNPRFSTHLFSAGAVLLIGGFLLEIGLFSAWLATEAAEPRRLSLAGVAQALILTGAVLIAFGLIYRITRMAAEYRDTAGSIDVGKLGAPGTDESSPRNG